MFIIVGLGNPTPLYEGTRHNVGFEVIDALSQKFLIPVKTKKHRAYTGSGMIGGQKVLLLKPQTYMNLSGESVRSAMNYYQETPDHLIVIYDDKDLDLGAIRIREKGSAGSHNGMKNIVENLKSQEFPRVRIGIGEKPERMDMKDYVMSRFSKGENEIIAEAALKAVDAIELIIKGDLETAMNRYNKKKHPRSNDLKETE